MSEPVAPETAPAAVRAERSAALVVGGVALAVVAATAILYSQRGPIGTRLAIDYLQRRGVPAQITIERLGPRGFVGSARLGPAADPDLTVERIEVEFAPFPIARNGLAPRIQAVRMVRPRLKARYVGGKLTFGSLQGLVDEFMAQPVEGPPPDVMIEDGAARITTEMGALNVAGGGAIAGGRIVRLDARMGAHHLANRTTQLDLEGASLQLRSANERLLGRFNVAAPRFLQDRLALEGATLNGVVDVPYGQGDQGFRGRVGLETTLQARRLTAGDSLVDGARAVATLGGSSSGELETLTLDGRGGVVVEAAAVSGPSSGRDLKWAASSTALHVIRTRRGVSFEGPLQFNGDAAVLQSGENRVAGLHLTGASAATRGNLDTTGVRLVSTPNLSLIADGAALGAADLRQVRLSLRSPEMTVASVGEGPRVSGAFSTDAAVGALLANDAALSRLALKGSGEAETVNRTIRMSWRGSARSEAGLSGAGVRKLADAARPAISNPAAFARFLETVRVDVPDLRFESVGDSGLLSLGRPARLVGETGEVAIQPVGEVALAEFGPTGLRGGLTLATSGAALPAITLELPAYRLTEAGLTANARLAAADLNAGPLQGVRLAAAGQIVPSAGGMAFTASDCASFSAVRFVGEDGALATDVRADACPDAGRPMASFGPRGWSAHLGLRNAAARLPDAEVEVARGAGTIDVAGNPAGMTAGALHLASVTVSDRAAQPRFLAIGASGDAALRGQTWDGDFVLVDSAGGRRLGTAKLRHDLSAGTGAVDFASELKFAQGGLQPAQISPLAATMATDADGSVSVGGHFGWSRTGVSSSGRVSTTGLSLQAPTGKVRGLKGDVVFTSLAPLATAPDQSVTVEHIDWLVPLDHAEATVTLTPTDLLIAKVQVGVAGGTAVLDPLDLKLAALLPTSGSLRLSDVELGQLVSQFNLADKVRIQAKVDGVLPFAFTSEGLRFADGRLFADGPGRVEIKREALTGVTASDESAQTPTNAMQSFAYQAMENLAFDQLDARIASQPGGRLGVVFHINGRNDPAIGRVPRVGIFELLQGKAFEKELPLPKGTPVDLTLDTSLNFDELMAAYSSAGRSTPVQP